MEEGAKIFIEFDYKETKDLMQSFISLVSGMIVFSVAFNDKILTGLSGNKNPKSTFFWILLFLFLSLVFAGISLVFILGAGACRIYGDGAIPVLPCDTWSLALMSWGSGMIAGFLFVIGLGWMVLSSRQ